MAIKIGRNNISEHLLEYQLSLIGKTVKDALKVGDWRNAWYFPREYEEKFKAYSIPLIKKVFKCRKERAISILDWFILQFGLKIQ